MKKQEQSQEEIYLQKLGKRIKELRKEKGFTNRDFLAYDSGVSRSLLISWEKGGNITFRNLIRIIKNGFKMEVEEFFSHGFDKENIAKPSENKELKSASKTKSRK